MLKEGEKAENGRDRGPENSGERNRKKEKEIQTQKNIFC
jgi:hypothetical protein